MGGIKISGKEKTGSNIQKKNCFGISMTKLTQKWVVEVCWTSLGFMAVLYSAVQCSAVQCSVVQFSAVCHSVIAEMSSAVLYVMKVTKSI